ncbi:MAG: trigger factor [Paracoccaceae bacterium]|nr:trigger factor [Paracoccaceae bacterium]
MQLIEKVNKGLNRGYEAKILASDIDLKVTKKLESSRSEVQLKGFRKGQAPIALLKKMYGKSMVGEAMQETIDELIRVHFEKSGDRPAQQPDVQMINKNWKEGDDIDVSLNYEKLPEIPETDFSKIKLKKLVAKIDKPSVEEALSNLASSTENFVKRKKTVKSKTGDQLIIDFLGKIKNEAFDGGKGEDYPLVLGSNSFIPGFEDQLVGTKEDQKLNVTVMFPKDYGSEKLAGQEAVFNVVVKSVNEPKPAKINDELAKKFGTADLNELKEQISERLKAEYGHATRAILKRELMDKLDKLIKFDLPTSLVESEANEIAHQLWHEENPEVKDHNHDKISPTDEHIKIANRRVKLGLLLAELGSKNKLVVSEKETQDALMQKAQEYPGQEKAFFEFIQKNPQAKEQINAPLFEDKVIDFIIELATITEKLISKDELKKAVEKIESV